MPIRLFVGITDREWYRQLRLLPDLDEVNFWAPKGTSFKALSAGELFLFKLHAPNHYIVGGGIFAYSNPAAVLLGMGSIWPGKWRTQLR